jgi:hypothetical protein
MLGVMNWLVGIVGTARIMQDFGMKVRKAKAKRDTIDLY